MRGTAEPSPSRLTPCHTPPFVAARHFPPARGKSALSRGRFCSTYRKMPKKLPLRGSCQARSGLTERVHSQNYPLRLTTFASSPKGTPFGAAAKCPGAPVSPSQALPRQLPQRGSQAIKFITKVLGAMRKLPAVLLALPLGELSPQVTERAQRQKRELDATNGSRLRGFTPRKSCRPFTFYGVVC